MPDRKLNRLIQHSAIFEDNTKCVGDRALVGIVIIGGEGGLLNTNNLGAERVDARTKYRICGDFVFVIGSREPAKQQRNRNHISQPYIARSGRDRRGWQAGLSYR